MKIRMQILSDKDEQTGRMYELNNIPSLFMAECVLVKLFNIASDE